jgi:hypothetical protein
MHIKKPKWILLALTSTAALHLQGCAQTPLDKRVDREVAQENTINTQADLKSEASRIIQTTPGLTDEQRIKLGALRKTTRAQTDALWTQSVKLRSVLMKDLITTNYNENEVELIKKKIKDLEDKRLSVTFNAVEQANTILGHNILKNQEPIMDTFFDDRELRD